MCALPGSIPKCWHIRKPPFLSPGWQKDSGDVGPLPSYPYLYDFLPDVLRTKGDVRKHPMEAAPVVSPPDAASLHLQVAGWPLIAFNIVTLL